MKHFPLLVTVAVALLTGCEAGTTETSGARLVSFTANYPTGEGCALYGDGAAVCRGENSFGAVGIGRALQFEYLPENTIPVETEASFTAISMFSGSHACALDRDGAAWCWGRNEEGQLGVADPAGPENCSYEPGWPETTELIPCATTPVKVASTLRFKTIYTARDRSCGLTAGRELWCWGSAAVDAFGRGIGALPGDCSGTSCPLPVRAAPGLTFQKIEMLQDGTCGIAADFILYCWGYEGWSTPRFGRDTGVVIDTRIPTPINSTAAIADFALAESHTCTVTTSGALMCFGANGSGQLGDSTNIGRTTPIQHRYSVAFRRIAAQGDRNCALDDAGRAWCWGGNNGGNLGLGHLLPALSPGRVLGDLTFQKIQVGAATNCATERGNIWCWGQLPSRFEQ